MLRIVAVADTHTFQHDLDVPDGDVFLHAGDLLRAGRLAELLPVAEWIGSLPHRHKVVVAGNHDWVFVRQQRAAIEFLGPSVTYLQDSGCVIDGVKFWGSPWQPTFHDWAFNLPRGRALREKWDLIPNDTDVLITHGPPRGYGDECGNPHRVGCDDLRAALARVRPRLHCFGHVHQDGGVWEVDGMHIANVTTWECDRAPTVFDLDPATGEVTPVDVPPKRPDF